MSELMPAKLFSMVGTTRGAAFEIAAEATIGRGDDNAIVLPQEAISRNHARIAYDPEEQCYVLEDAGSRNGTEIDGVRVRDRERLGHLHVITFADRYDFIFQDPELCARRHPETEALPSSEGVDKTVLEPLPPAMLPPTLQPPTSSLGDEAERTQLAKAMVPLPELPAQGGPPEPEATEVPEREKSRGTFLLEIIDPEELRERIELREGENLVGRGLDADVQLKNPNVSRRHAVVTVREGKVTVEDQGSQNHTFLDDEQIDAVRELPPNAEIRFGSVTARLIGPDDS